MHGAHAFLTALAMVLCVAAVTSVVFQRFRQPVVLGYILAGLVVGPHVPIPLVADRQIILTLSELGVILLMFSLGLEFRLKKLVEMGPSAGLTAIIQCSIMLWLGFLTGRAFGWTTLESIFVGAMIAVSSTTIIAKAFEEQRIRGPLRDLVVGVLIVEDLIAIVLMTVLTALSSGGAVSASTLAESGMRLGFFVLGMLFFGMLLVPRAVKYVQKFNRAETTLLATIGLCFASALLAQNFGYSVALGAFIGGSLVAESGEGRRIEHLIEPVRDMFAAIFFVSVGMLIDPALVLQHWQAIAVLTVLVIAGKIISVALGAFLTGNGTRISVRAGMSLAQIGEFSFIIAALGVSLGAIGEFLYPIAIAVSAITTLSTPWLIRASDGAAMLLDRNLPKPLQTFTALYGSWFERLKQTPSESSYRVAVRRHVRNLLIDTVLLGAVIIGAAVYFDPARDLLVGHLALPLAVANGVVLTGVLAVMLPFGMGLLAIARRLGRTLADAVFPPADSGQMDRASAPRLALIVTVQIVITLLAGLPLVAITQPFIPGLRSAQVLAVVLVITGFFFWRRARNLHGHVRAGAELIAEVLSKQTHPGEVTDFGSTTLSQVNVLLPGLGEPVPVRLVPGSPAIGRTLAELNIRGVTAATVLVIRRDDARNIIVPAGGEVLCTNDVLTLAGTHEAVAAAQALLLGQGGRT